MTSIYTSLHIITDHCFKHVVALTNRFRWQQQAVSVDPISASGFHIRSSHGSIQRSAATLRSILRSNACGRHRNERICCRVARTQASWSRKPTHHYKINTLYIYIIYKSYISEHYHTVNTFTSFGMLAVACGLLVRCIPTENTKKKHKPSSDAITYWTLSRQSPCTPGWAEERHRDWTILKYAKVVFQRSTLQTSAMTGNHKGCKMI